MPPDEPMPPDQQTPPDDDYGELQPWLEQFHSADMELLARAEADYLEEHIPLLKQQRDLLEVMEKLRIFQSLPLVDVLRALEELLKQCPDTRPDEEPED